MAKQLILDQSFLVRVQVSQMQALERVASNRYRWQLNGWSWETFLEVQFNHPLRRVSDACCQASYFKQNGGFPHR